MSWIDDLNNAKPAASREGEFFAGPEDRGQAVLLGAKIFKGTEDPHTYQLLFGVKASAGPNAAGSRRVVIKQLDTRPYEKGFAKTQVAQMLGIQPDSPSLGAAFSALFRLDANGYTDETKPCPGAGTEYNFSVRTTTTKKGKGIAVPDFAPVKYADKAAEDAAIAANKAQFSV